MYERLISYNNDIKEIRKIFRMVTIDCYS